MKNSPVIIDVGRPPVKSRPMNVLEQKEKAVIDADGKATVKTFVRVPSNNYGTAIFLALMIVILTILSAGGGAFSFISTLMGTTTLTIIYLLFTSTKWVEVK